MSSLTRWDPFRELDELQGRFANLFGRAPIRKEGEREEKMTLVDWAPLVDVIEGEKDYTIKAELPEVRREDVKVTVQNDVLSIAGERLREKEEKGKKFHRIERAYGAFSRSFTLPEDADPAKVSADFKSGVLTVRLAKSEHAKPKTVEVTVT
jgi:HSP20 family protein